MKKLVVGDVGWGKSYTLEKLVEQNPDSFVFLTQENFNQLPLLFQTPKTLIVEDLEEFDKRKQGKILELLKSVENCILTTCELSKVSQEIKQSCSIEEMKKPPVEQIAKIVKTANPNLNEGVVHKIALDSKGNIYWALVSAKYQINSNTIEKEKDVLEVLSLLTGKNGRNSVARVLKSIPFPVLYNWFSVSFFMLSLKEQLALTKNLSKIDSLIYKTKPLFLCSAIAYSFPTCKLAWKYSKKQKTNIDLESMILEEINKKQEKTKNPEIKTSQTKFVNLSEW